MMHILRGRLLSDGGLRGGGASLQLSGGFFVFVEDGNAMAVVVVVAVATFSLSRRWRT